MYIGTVFIGDAINPPVLKAAANFSDDYMIYAKDPRYGGTINFYVALKNVVIDSTAVAPATSIKLLDWTVSQATQITNVVFNMPTDSSHIGMRIGEWDGDSGYNSNIIINDITFNGGSIGIYANGQQWLFKGIKFNGCRTGAQLGGHDIVVTSSSFENCKTAIEATSIGGSLVVLDTTTTTNGTFIFSNNTYEPNSIVLENVQHSGTTVFMNNQTLLTGSVPDTWFRGNAVSLAEPSPNTPK